MLDFLIKTLSDGTKELCVDEIYTEQEVFLIMTTQPRKAVRGDGERKTD